MHISYDLGQLGLVYSYFSRAFPPLANIYVQMQF